jgi:hypothetical protein
MPTPKKGPKDSVAAVAKRFGITAREARDIATAVGSLTQATAHHLTNKKNGNVDGKDKMGEIKTRSAVTKTAANLRRQVKETRKAATTGKSGTTSAKFADSNLAPGNKQLRPGYKRGK